MTKSVFILTHRRGFEVDPVMDELCRRNIDVFRFNTDAGEEVSLTSFISKENIEFSCDGRRISSSDINIAWCQQLPPYLGQASTESGCLQRESLLALQIPVFDFLSADWFNRPSSVLYASNKVNQLATAQSIGLAIPKTLVSNDPSAIRSFASGEVIIAKNLATPWITYPNRRTRAAYTKIVDPKWLLDDKALSFAPIIYQEYCERRRDIRVTVIDGKMFSVSCTPEKHQQEDIRKDGGTGESYEICEFDKELFDKLVKLMHIFRLDYCAADFMEDKKGNLFFLEVNTCGAWWWVDRLYDGAICLTLADALQSRLGGLA
ncbi:MAG TPA: hypothetical protein ENN31_01140 [Candidatus Vogelbacteria bacterium]|nr:hypothetical protein [Candidatus Vogelbacteria bacterium]